MLRSNACIIRLPIDCYLVSEQRFVLKQNRKNMYMYLYIHNGTGTHTQKFQYINV